MSNPTVKRIAIFASGSGSNAEKIMERFAQSEAIKVELVLANKAKAGVLARAEKYNVPNLVFNREQFYESTYIIDLLKEKEIDLVVLAGFLWLVPESLVAAFPNQIINIHPALLPKYGGKGMYGAHVHQAVVDNQEKESGITIHYVNENYDEGNIIFQASCEVVLTDTKEDVAVKVQKLEHEHFPRVVEELLQD